MRSSLVGWIMAAIVPCFFEISADTSRELEGKERKAVWEKFRRLDKKRFEEHKRKITEQRKHESS